MKSIEEKVLEFKILDIILIGSFYEEMKNEVFNEFDFMLVLKELLGFGKFNLY